MASKLTVTPRWRFILHGGCRQSWANEQRQREVSQSLRHVADLTSRALDAGQKAKDVVALAVAALEDCAIFNAGHGAALSRDGVHQLEAGIVDGSTAEYGAVTCTETIKNPILGAKALMNHGPHSMLAGRLPAENLAEVHGLEKVENSYFTTSGQKAYWEQQLTTPIESLTFADPGTVGAVVLDASGRLAAAGSTGGPTAKRQGRIGDTAVLGAGLYADSRVAVICSGDGDQIFKQLLAANIAKYHFAGSNVSTAAKKALLDMVSKGSTGAVAVIDAQGNCAIESTARLFAAVTGPPLTLSGSCLMPSTIPILPAHEIYRDQNLLVGHSRFPTTSGHTLAILRSGKDLFSLDKDTFVKVMLSTSSIASTITDHFHVKRTAFVSDGSESMSLLPLHGLDCSWTPVISDLKEYHEVFPGYVSSKDGPKMSDGELDRICAKIRSNSSITKPFNSDFDGPLHDTNIFARIIRGEIAHWRIWEDDRHVAFLTPFPNTPGFTVLAPRRHLSSDIFRMDSESYTDLMKAAHTVAQILKVSFASSRCGMIFEGFEVDYAHAKLIPIHDPEIKNDAGPSNHTPLKVSPYQNKYEGYISSLPGEKASTFPKLAEDSQSLKALLLSPLAKAPRSWTEPSRHLVAVLEDPWYKHLFSAQNALFHISIAFFRQSLGYEYCFLPATTDAVSSPMGLGSDSEPVLITLLGQETHLADSMQFCLEYALRIQPNAPGVYYVNTSFRGEDPDAMHLNQFYHAECELLGNFDQGIVVAERYVITLVECFLRDHADVVNAVAGGVGHLDDLLRHYSLHGDRFPQITLSEALELPGIDDSCWKYVVDSDPGKGRSLTRWTI